MTKEQAFAIWESLFGDSDSAYDFASHPIWKEDFQNGETGFGWDVDLIQPQNHGGYPADGNYVIESIGTMAIRDGRTSFRIGNFTYEVRKGRRYGSYDIFDVTDRNHPVSMAPSEENQSEVYNSVRMHDSVKAEPSVQTPVFRNPSSFYQRPEVNAVPVSEPRHETSFEDLTAFAAPVTAETASQTDVNEAMLEEEAESLEEAEDTAAADDAGQKADEAEEISDDAEESSEEITEDSAKEPSDMPENEADPETTAVAEEADDDEEDMMISPDDFVPITDDPAKTPEGQDDEPAEEQESMDENPDDMTAQADDSETASDAQNITQDVTEDAESVEETEDPEDQPDEQATDVLPKAGEEPMESIPGSVGETPSQDTYDRSADQPDTTDEAHEQTPLEAMDELTAMLDAERQESKPEAAGEQPEPSHEDRIHELEAEIDRLNAEKTQLRQQMDLKIGDREGRLAALLNTVTQIQQEKAELEARLAELKDDQKPAEEPRQTTASDGEDYAAGWLAEKEKTEVLEAELARKKEELASLAGVRDENEHLRAEKEELNSLLETSDAENKALQERLNQADADQSERATAQEQSDQDKEALNQQIAMLQAQLQDKDDQIQALTAELGALKADNEQAQAQAEQSIAENNDALTALKEQYEAVVRERNEKEAQDSALALAHAASLADKDKVIADKDALLQANQDSLAQANAALEAATREKAELENTLQEKDDEILKLNATLEEASKAKEEALSQQAHVAEEQAMKLAQAEAETADLKTRYDKLSLDYAAATNDVSTLTESRDNLAKNLADKTLREQEATEKAQKLAQELSDVSAQLVARNEEYDRMASEFYDLKSKYESNQTMMDNLRKDREDAILKAKELEEQNTQIHSLAVSTDQRNSQLEQSNKDLTELADQATKEAERLHDIITFMKLGGAEDAFDAMVASLEAMDQTVDETTMKDALMANPKWLAHTSKTVCQTPEASETFLDVVKTTPDIDTFSPEDLSQLSAEQAKRAKAMAIFDARFQRSAEASDFAGRIIRRDCYQDATSRYGWDIMELMPGNEDPRTLILGSYPSLKDVTLVAPFNSNGHQYQVVEEDGIKTLVSLEYITNIFDYNETMKVINRSADQKKPLIYCFVKFFDVNPEKRPDANEMQKFVSLIECTVSRVCINSYMELHNASDYVFLTFDGTVDNAYEEIRRYSILLNTYRRAFAADGKLNAIIVVGQVTTEKSNWHFGFEQLSRVTQDKEMRAIVYDLNSTSVVNTAIRKCVHYGPSILNALQMPAEYLKESNLGKGGFAQAYGFNKVFMQTVLSFNINYPQKKKN